MCKLVDYQYTLQLLGELAADYSGLSVDQFWHRVKTGHFSGEDILDLYLNNEGIFGFTTAIIDAVFALQTAGLLDPKDNHSQRKDGTYYGLA